MHIVGIDASLTSTGITIMQRDKTPIYAGKIMTEKKNFPGLRERCYFITEEIIRIVRLYDAFPFGVMENGFIRMASPGDGLKLGYLRGMISYSFTTHGYPFKEKEPKEIRKDLGYGNMTKEEVFEYVINEYAGANEIINAIGPYSDKPGKKKTSDIYDSVSIALSEIEFIKNNSKG